MRNRESLIEEAVESLLTTLDMPEILRRTAALLRKHFGGTRVGVNRWRPERPDEAEVLLVDDSRHPTPRPGTVFQLIGTASERVIRTRESVSVNHLAAGRTGYLEEQTLSAYGYGALACFPLVADGKVLGTLDIAHKPQEELLCQCFQPAEQISKLIAIALHNSLMVAEIKRLNELLDRENTLLKSQIQQTDMQWRYVAESPAMQAVLEKVRMVAPSETTVLIRGETGTGKEGIARLVHQESERSQGPFVPVNLAAIPETLIESELFGHEKGAFSGAVKRKLGRFEQASGGTLFLDEVGDAPASVQVKLLRALQEREIQRVGGDDAVPVDIRLVAATNKPLEQLVDVGEFRSDLYYRLNIFPVELPPLRERSQDLRPLARHLLERHATRMHRRPPAVPDQVWQELEAHDWPGNVRELENTLERALILSPGDQLELTRPSGAMSVAPRGAEPAAEPATVPTFDDGVRSLLTRALEQTGGRIYGPKGAAALLDLKPTTLQGKLRKHRITDRGSRSE
ncbi:MAG: sigma 54-interacting transcriptional regulator [bacterium]